MDCQMPEMDGYTATRRIRDAETGVLNPKIPGIIRDDSARTGRRPGRSALNAGMNDYLTKPVKKETLAAHWKNGRILREGTLRDLSNQGSEARSEE